MKLKLLLEINIALHLFTAKLLELNIALPVFSIHLLAASFLSQAARSFHTKFHSCCFVVVTIFLIGLIPIVFAVMSHPFDLL